MRIIHGSDYYDSALAFGSDTSIVLVREKSWILDHEQLRSTSELVLPLIGLRAKNNKRRSMDLSHGWTDSLGLDHNLQPIKVWIAGTEWHGLWHRSGVPGHASNESFIWHWRSVDQLMNQHGLVLEDQARKHTWWRQENIGEDWFGEQPSSPSTVSWMSKNRVSIITCVPAQQQYRTWHVRLNGDNLKDVQFFKAIDAYSLFQRLAQWVGGVLPNQGNPTVDITDDRIKIHKHGFDKWSFRKLPSKGE